MLTSVRHCLFNRGLRLSTALAFLSALDGISIRLYCAAAGAESLEALVGILITVLITVDVAAFIKHTLLMGSVAVSVVVVGVSALIALLSIDERCAVLGAAHCTISSIFLIALGAVSISLTMIATFITVSIAVMLLAGAYIVLIDGALEVAVLNTLIIIARLAALIAVAIIVVCIATIVALLAQIAWTSAIITYAICFFSVLNLICHAALGAVLEHTTFFVALIAAAIGVIYFTILRTLQIRTLLIGIRFLLIFIAIFAQVPCIGRCSLLIRAIGMCH